MRTEEKYNAEITASKKRINSDGRRLCVVILLSYVVIVIITALLIDWRHAEITLLGDAEVTLEAGEVYKDAGAYASTEGRLFGRGKYLKLSVDSDLDTSTPGNYVISYRTKYMGKPVSAERTVVVLEKEAETEAPGGHEPSFVYNLLFGMGNSKERPHLSGHRGMKNLMPENTIPAFRTAGDLCMSQCETDVRTTSDGVMVCMHDDIIDWTTNGTGYVSDLSYEQLQQYYVDVQPNVGLPEDELRVPTLEEYILVCRSYGMICEIELKEDIGPAVIELLQKYGMEHCAMLSAIKLEYLLHAREVSDIWLHWIVGATSLETVDEIAGVGNISMSFAYKTEADIPDNLAEYCSERDVCYIFQRSDDYDSYSWKLENGTLFSSTNEMLPIDVAVHAGE